MATFNGLETLGLFVGIDRAFLENLTVESGISPCKVVHVSKGIFELRFIYLRKPAKFVLRET